MTVEEEEVALTLRKPAPGATTALHVTPSSIERKKRAMDVVANQVPEFLT
jgi:hypothetical protein